MNFKTVSSLYYLTQTQTRLFKVDSDVTGVFYNFSLKNLLHGFQIFGCVKVSIDLILGTLIQNLVSHLVYVNSFTSLVTFQVKFMIFY